MAEGLCMDRPAMAPSNGTAEEAWLGTEEVAICSCVPSSLPSLVACSTSQQASHKLKPAHCSHSYLPTNSGDVSQESAKELASALQHFTNKHHTAYSIRHGAPLRGT